MNKIDEVAVASSWIADLDYDAITNTISMTTLQGNTYDIPGMNVQDFTDWLAASSKGKHWHYDIRPRI